MPAKNRIKQYIDGAYYHLYNRGIEKRVIFLDEQDYAVFLSYLKEYLSPKHEDALHERLNDPHISPREKDKVLKILRMNNFSDEITLLAYCLMPNHFHFFIKQKNAGAIDAFMNSLGTRYTMYFNKKYKRVGSLYQGVYKAVLVATEPQFLHLSRYIHKQALRLQGQALRDQPSSFSEYLGNRTTPWVHPEEILQYFSKTNSSLSYEAFVKQDEDLQIIKDVILEELEH